MTRCSDGLLAQVVIDAEDLVLAEDRVHHLVERERGRAVVAERLLDDDAGPPGPASQTVLADRPDDRLVCRRRRGEVEEPVRVRPEGEVELVERAPKSSAASSGVARRERSAKLRQTSSFRVCPASDRRRSAAPRDYCSWLALRACPHRERRRQEALQREVVERG